MCEIPAQLTHAPQTQTSHHAPAPVPGIAPMVGNQAMLNQAGARRTQRMRFTQDEDAILTRLVETYGRSWVEIAQHMPGRTSRQCRERWLHYLDPNHRSFSEWSPEENQLLFRLHSELGSKWCAIAARLNRTDIEVKNQFVRLNGRISKTRGTLFEWDSIDQAIENGKTFIDSQVTICCNHNEQMIAVVDAVFRDDSGKHPGFPYELIDYKLSHHGGLTSNQSEVYHNLSSVGGRILSGTLLNTEIPPGVNVQIVRPPARITPPEPPIELFRAYPESIYDFSNPFDTQDILTIDPFAFDYLW